MGIRLAAVICFLIVLFTWLCDVLPDTPVETSLSFCPSKEIRNTYNLCKEIKHDVTI